MAILVWMPRNFERDEKETEDLYFPIFCFTVLVIYLLPIASAIKQQHALSSYTSDSLPNLAFILFQAAGNSIFFSPKSLSSGNILAILVELCQNGRKEKHLSTELNANFCLTLQMH